MPRTARAIVAEHCYHVINRANQRAKIFRCEGDYKAFLSVLAEAQDRFALPILAACVMPNHLHLVVRPRTNVDVARFTHWAFTTHVRRYHKVHSSTGRLWQGRFKAFLIQQDHHLLTVMRYVERNALRAQLCARAEGWAWGSLNWRGAVSQPLTLDPSPVPLPSCWTEFVNTAQSDVEIAEIRTCVNRQRPFGRAEWVALKACELGLAQSITPRGRPRKDRTGGPSPFASK